MIYHVGDLFKKRSSGIQATGGVKKQCVCMYVYIYIYIYIIA